jgi:hypothetical protein
MSTRKSAPAVTAARPEVPPKITRGALKHRFAILMHRLEVASDKLDMVVAHYPAPNRCSDGDMGAIAVTRDVAKEVATLYSDFSDTLKEAELEQFGGLYHFPEDQPDAENAADVDARS